MKNVFQKQSIIPSDFLERISIENLNVQTWTNVRLNCVLDNYFKDEIFSVYHPETKMIDIWNECNDIHFFGEILDREVSIYDMVFDSFISNVLNLKLKDNKTILETINIKELYDIDKMFKENPTDYEDIRKKLFKIKFTEKIEDKDIVSRYLYCALERFLNDCHFEQSLKYFVIGIADLNKIYNKTTYYDDASKMICDVIRKTFNVNEIFSIL